MVGLLLERDDVDGARSHWTLLSSRAEQQSTYAAMRSRMDAAEAASKLPPAEILERRILLDEGDLQARLELAELCIARRQFEGALAQLLEIVKRDRAFGDDIGRRKMLEVFEIAASEEALVGDYRAKLSLELF
jgi:putative thioredoxin